MSFGYGEKDGPHTWPLHFPDAAGTRQSPININTEAINYDKTLEPIRVDFSQISKQILNAKDHNFNVEVSGNGILSGGPLKSEYLLTQFHFHWGSGSNWGSEHMINGVCCSSELHCVFRNANYGLSESLLEHPDGLAVLGIFIQSGTIPNPAMKKICALLPSMSKGESKPIHPTLDLNNFVPNDLSRYYTYPGSLTTPPCAECVTWIVMDEPVSMSLEQLETLQQWHANCESCGRTDNFRPVCPVGSRTVRSSFPC